MATIFQTLGAIVYQGFTTTERDDLNARERMTLWNTTTEQWEMYLSGVWRAVLILDTDGNITAAQHGTLANDLHPEYARTAAPEEITTSWILKSGGSIRATPGDPPTGEVVIQVKTSTGAPTHSASLGTLCWVSPDATLYANTSGSTSWTKQAADSSLHAQSHTLASHSTKPHSALSDAPANAHHVAFVQADADALYDVLNGLSSHVAAGDPHTGYRLESVALKVRNAISIPVKKPLPGIANDAAAQPLSAPFALANCTKLKARARSNLAANATFRVTIAGTDRGSVTISSGNSVGTATVTAFSIAEDAEIDIDLTAGGTDDIAVAVTVIGEQEIF